MEKKYLPPSPVNPYDTITNNTNYLLFINILLLNNTFINKGIIIVFNYL